MKNLLVLLLLVALALFSAQAFAARRSDRMESPQQASFVAGSAPSLEKVRESIRQAGLARGWQVTSEQPGRMTLSNNVRGKHLVVVNVLFDTRGVRVEYVSSENLDYELRDGTAYIHPKYNEWVAKLLQGIVSRVSS